MVFVVNCLRDPYTGFQFANGEIVMDGRTLADDEFITFVSGPYAIRSFFPMIKEKGTTKLFIQIY